jgi:3-methyladenine DNA glycosylase AlkD
MDYKEIIDCLHALANPEKVKFKEKKFGIKSNNSLGVYHKDLTTIAKAIGKNSELAEKLIENEIYEAKLLGSKIFKPKDLTKKQVNSWIKYFNNWEICDSFSMGIFSKSPLAKEIIEELVTRESEFEKRSGFATLSSYCMADKKADNEVYEKFLPIIINSSSDQRLYVKKAVNWALRSIGKRNCDLHSLALSTAYKILEQNTSSAIWIAKDAIHELESHKLKTLDYPRDIYRPNSLKKS